MVRTNRKSLQWQYEEPAINLTALIDVVFVVLIMFIIIAPLLEMDQVELASHPSTELSGGVQENSPISIRVLADNTVQLNKKTVALGNLTALLKEAKQKFPNAKPQLLHDKKAQFGTYQEIKNSAEAAGFRQLDIILQPG